MENALMTPIFSIGSLGKPLNEVVTVTPHPRSQSLPGTVRRREMKTGISEASEKVSIFSFATQGGKQVSFYFRQGNWVQARDAQIRFPAG